MNSKISQEIIFEHDVCFSFAGEDREYVNKVANILKERGIRVFYDNFYKVDLWGKDLFQHLDYVYKKAAKYCVLFVSEHYAKKRWTNHELRSAQERAFQENATYILPAIFDDTEIPGIRSTTGHIDLRSTTPVELADLIVKKVGNTPKSNYFPPNPDLLYEKFTAKTQLEQEEIFSLAYSFFGQLKRMSQDERAVIFSIFMFGCTEDLPHNMHIEIDLLRRTTGFPKTQLIEIVGSLRSLWFSSKIEKVDHCGEELGETELLIIEWEDQRIDGTLDNYTVIPYEMISMALEGYCESCGHAALQRLDFSQLSSSTKTEEEH